MVVWCSVFSGLCLVLGDCSSCVDCCCLLFVVVWLLCDVCCGLCCVLCVERCVLCVAC